MNPTPSDQESATLQRYLRLLRAQRVLIVAAVVVGAAVALAYSLVQKSTYEATAQLRFNDESVDLTVLGISDAPSLQAQQGVAAKAQVITGAAVLAGVTRDLGGALTITKLRDNVSTKIDPVSNLVNVSVKARSADLATTAANAFAAETIAVQNGTERHRLTSTAAKLEKRIEGLGNGIADRSRRKAYSDQISRLTALSTFARPVELTEAAKRPDSPVSPKPLRNAVLGGFLGLLLGLLVAYGRDTLDRRLRSAEEIARHLGLRPLGMVGEEALGHVPGLGPDRATARAGDLEPFRILRTNLEFLGDGRPRVLLVTSGLPDEGKSTVAAALALALAAAGQSTVLVETDLRRPALAGRLGVAAEPGLSDYLLERADLTAVAQTVEAQLEAPVNGSTPSAGSGVSLHCIAAGAATGRPAELLATERFGELLRQLAGTYDAVVLDSCPLLPVVDTREIVPHVDAAVVCVRAHRTTRTEADAVRSTLDLLPAKPMGAVITGVRRKGDEEYHRAGYGYGYGEPTAHAGTARV